MEFVQHEEPKSLRRLNDRVLVGPGEDQLEHHVVRQQDVGRRGQDCLPILVALLPGVTPERHRLASPRPRAERKELLELTRLAVRERVHRVDDDRLDALA